MNQDQDPTGSRDPIIDKMLGEQFKEDMAALNVDLEITGQAKRDQKPERLKIDLLTTKTHVILEFSQPIRWLNIPPDLAIDLGNQLRKWGRKAVKKQYGDKK